MKTNYPIEAIAGFIFINLLTFFNGVTAQCNANQTTTYNILKGEATLLGDNSKEIASCLQLMNTASQRIKKKYTPQKIQQAEETAAIEILAIIDKTFTDFDFFFDTDPTDLHYDFLTRSFHDWFTGYPPNIAQNENRLRLWESLNRNSYRTIDCDLYCAIYKGIAEMNNLPLTIAELPHHSFMRWHFPTGSFINWEAIAGKCYRTPYKLSNYADYSRLDATSQKKYLQDWTTDDITAYYADLLANAYGYNDKYKDIPRSKKEYEKILFLTNKLPAHLSNYCWLYVKDPKPEDGFDTKKQTLLKYMNSALAVCRIGSYYGTIAGIYARAGDFKKAVDFAKEGLRHPYLERDVKNLAEKYLTWYQRCINVEQGTKTNLSALPSPD